MQLFAIVVGVTPFQCFAAMTAPRHGVHNINDLKIKKIILTKDICIKKSK